MINANELTQKVRELLPESDYIIEARSIEKNNGVMLTGIVIGKKGAPIAPTLYYDSASEQSVNNLAVNLVEDYYKHMESEIGRFCQNFHDEGLFLTKDFVTKNVVPIVVNEDKNKHMLDKMPHFHIISDLCYIFKIPVFEKRDVVTGWITLTDDLIATIDGLTVDKIRAAALNNIHDNFECRSIIDFLIDKGYLDDAPEEIVEAMKEQNPMNFITNKTRTYGANCLLNDDILKEALAQCCSDAMVIIPSSIHECITLPLENGMDAEDIDNLIRMVNVDDVDPEEVLSDYSLIYDGDDLVATKDYLKHIA